MTRPRLVTGPLAPFADGFCEGLAGQGYSQQAVGDHRQLVGDLSRWLSDEGVDVAQLTTPAIEGFLRARRKAGHVSLVSLRGLTPLLGYLGGLGVLPVDDVTATDAERLQAHYCEYLLNERGLAAGSVRLYEGVVHRFLSERSEPLGDDLARLSVADIHGFVLRESGRRGVASAKTTVCALRSLLGFLDVEGFTAMPLAGTVPAVAGRRHGQLPRPVSVGDVALLLDSCDRDTALGRRDFAILTVLTRLGLRAGEVAALELGDVDWRTGEVMIRGKGRRLERLPLPNDVGEAVVEYLRRGRPKVPCRHLFVRSCAPLTGLSRSAPTSVVRAACRRAGIAPIGAHRLRHGLATELLRQGAALPEIGQVLRHKSLLTTSIYAKVDRVALSPLALPWPGAQA